MLLAADNIQASVAMNQTSDSVQDFSVLFPADINVWANAQSFTPFEAVVLSFNVDPDDLSVAIELPDPEPTSGASTFFGFQEPSAMPKTTALYFGQHDAEFNRRQTQLTRAIRTNAIKTVGTRDGAPLLARLDFTRWAASASWPLPEWLAASSAQTTVAEPASGDPVAAPQPKPAKPVGGEKLRQAVVKFAIDFLRQWRQRRKPSKTEIAKKFVASVTGPARLLADAGCRKVPSERHVMNILTDTRDAWQGTPTQAESNPANLPNAPIVKQRWSSLKH